MRWLVGDIQGCAGEFEDLLRQVRFDPGQDELWCLGDLVNRGPDSLAVLRLWRDVSGRCVLGNHDVYALLARSERVARKRDTLEALFSSDEADGLLARLREQPVLAHLSGTDGVHDAWMVHAGLDPRWSDPWEIARKLDSRAHDDDWLSSEDVAFATRVRCCDASGQRTNHTGPPGECPPPFRPWDEFYRGRTLVVHGHWASRGYYRTERTMGLDSACVWGGPLTAWCFEEDRIAQVPSRESGRSKTIVDLGASGGGLG